MAEVIDQPEAVTTPEAPTTPDSDLPDSDLIAAIRSVLEASSEPLTLSKIRTGLPSRLRSLELEALAEVLRRQVAANVLVQYPKYRSPQDRFWDRPMDVHLQYLLRSTLSEKPLSWSEIRRKLPDYAKTLAEPVLEEQVVRGTLFRHPPLNSRTGPRFGAGSPEARDYLRPELAKVFERLQQLGFSRTELREGAMELLNEEEWDMPARTGTTAEPATASRAEASANAPPLAGDGAAGQAAAEGRVETVPAPETLASPS